MIRLKKQGVFYIKITAVCILCCLSLVAGGYFYLHRSLKPAEGQASEIPYSFSLPDNKGLLFDIAGNRTFVYLDFENELMNVIIPQAESFDPTDFGYSGDFELRGELPVLAALIDYAGGITLQENGEQTRYTGVQVTDILSRSTDSEQLLRRIIPAILRSVAENGLEDEAFNYIIDKSDTDLTVPDCLAWRNYISRLCENGRIIN